MIETQKHPISHFYSQPSKQKRKFSSFFKSLVIELDKELYGPDNHLVEVRGPQDTKLSPLSGVMGLVISSVPFFPASGIGCPPLRRQMASR